MIVRARTLLVLFALGATLGLFLDWLHVVSGTTRYADPGWWGQPWWVPLLFGGASAALGANRLLLARWLEEVRPPPTFEYVDPSPGLFVFGVALWLPLLYVCAAASVGTIARATNGPDPV